MTSKVFKYTSYAMINVDQSSMINVDQSYSLWLIAWKVMVRMNPPSDTIEAVDRVYVVEFGEVSFVAIAEVFVHRDM